MVKELKINNAEDRIRTCVGTKPIGVVVHCRFHFLLRTPKLGQHKLLSRLATPAPPHK